MDCLRKSTYQEALLVAEDLFHIKHKSPLALDEDVQTEFIRGINSMLWESMKEQLHRDDDFLTAKEVTKMLTGIEMPEPPPSEQERQEFIELCRELLWNDVVKRCRA